MTIVYYYVDRRRPGGPWLFGTLRHLAKAGAIKAARRTVEEGVDVRVRKYMASEDIVWRNKPLRKGRVKKND